MREQLEHLKSDLRAFPPAAWYLYLGVFLNKFGTFVVPFLAIYLTRKGCSAQQAGLAIGAYGLGTLMASLLGGWLADHVGRRRTIILSMFLGGATILALSQAQVVPMVIACAALAGLAGEMYRPASSALLADVVPAGHRLTAFATYRLSINAGFAFGPSIAGLLATYSFTWLFVGDAATSFLFALVALLALPKDRIRAERGDSWARAIRHVLRNGAFLRLLAAAFCTGLVFVQFLCTFGMQIVREGYSERVCGLLMSLNGALVVIGEVPMTLWTRRLNPRVAMAVGFVLIAAGFGMVGLATTPFGFAVAVATLTLGETISMPVAFAHAANLAPEALRGRYMGVYGLAWASTMVVGPYLGMSLFAVNPSWVWGGCVALGLVGAGLVWGGEDRDAVPEAGFEPVRAVAEIDNVSAVESATGK